MSSDQTALYVAESPSWLRSKGTGHCNNLLNLSPSVKICRFFGPVIFLFVLTNLAEGKYLVLPYHSLPEKLCSGQVRPMFTKLPRPTSNCC